jgi:hypothetical protein
MTANLTSSHFFLTGGPPAANKFGKAAAQGCNCLAVIPVYNRNPYAKRLFEIFSALLQPFFAITRVRAPTEM